MWAATGPLTAAPPPLYAATPPVFNITTADIGAANAPQFRVRTRTVTGNGLVGWLDETAAPVQDTRQYTTRQTWQPFGGAGADIVGPPPGAPETGCIPFDHPALQHVRNIVPATIHEMLWVAGSACCTYPLNGDVDVWLGWLAEESTTAQRRHWLTVSQYEGNTARDLPESEIYPGQQSVLLYAGVAPDGTRIHILGALAPMLDVIGNFDISCHAVGVRLSDGFTRAHPLCTRSYHVEILSWTDARKTLMRGIKFSERYGDSGFWQRSSTQRCAAEAFDMPYVTAEMAERVQALSVSEGL